MKTIENIASFSKEVTFEEGEFLLHTGEPADQFYLILHGNVMIEISPGHHSDVNIQNVEDGEVLGWSWLIPPYKWQFDAKANDFIRAIAVDGSLLRAMCRHNHDTGFEILTRLIQIVAKRLQATRLQFWDIYKMHYLMSGPF